MFRLHLDIIQFVICIKKSKKSSVSLECTSSQIPESPSKTFLSLLPPFPLSPFFPLFPLSVRCSKLPHPCTLLEARCSVLTIPTRRLLLVACRLLLIDSTSLATHLRQLSLSLSLSLLIKGGPSILYFIRLEKEKRNPKYIIKSSLQFVYLTMKEIIDKL